MKLSFFLLTLLSAEKTVNAFSSRAADTAIACPIVDRHSSTSTSGVHNTNKDNARPLLRKFAQGIQRRILDSEDGFHRFGMIGSYASDETIPCLEMRTERNGAKEDRQVSSRGTIRRAFEESSGSHQEYIHDDLSRVHGRSSGSGCTIVKLTGEDADAIHGLVEYGDRFFEQVDNEDRNQQIKDVGVFRVANHVFAGYDDNVNDEGKMQFLDTRILPNQRKADEKGHNNADPLLLPMEVGDLVGTQSLSNAHKGMNTLFDIGSQITSAVLGMDAQSVNKLIDDGTQGQHQQSQKMADSISNSYHRLIRYLEPQQSDSNDAAFQSHVDAAFLTLIPMPELPGLEVWCPSNEMRDGNESTRRTGEWVRPIKPVVEENALDSNGEESNCAYVIAMAGGFLQLTSDGQVPTCIHRVIPPTAPDTSNFGFGPKQYKPRISAPLFLRPRRGEDALLDVSADLRLVEQSHFPSDNTRSSGGLYHEKGLLDECNSMHLWSAHETIMTPQ